MFTICKRELKSYFLTPVGYVFIGIFLLLSGVCFGIINLASRFGSMLYTLEYMSYIWMLLSPVLILKLIAGERHRHADRLYYSLPCSLFSVVAGKFAAACTVMLLAVFLTLVYPLLIALYGKLYVPETVAGYIGFILQGMAYIALDLFVSSLARTQVTASVACVGVNLFLWLADLIRDAAPDRIFGNIFSFISLYRRFEPFASGRVSFASAVFYILFIITMLFLSIRVLDARRWSNT